MMCSNFEGEPLLLRDMSRNELINYIETCSKCNEEKIAIKLKFKEGQCEKCFLVYARHKFRASLGSTKIVSRGAKILIVYDGGPKSSVLMDMLKFALFQDAYKKLHFEPNVLYIDDSVLFNLSEEQTKTRLRRVGRLLKQFGFTTYCTSIAESDHELTSFDDYVEDGNVSKENIETFKVKFKSIASYTSYDDYISNLRTNIIRNIAAQLEAKFAFTSEIESDLAKIFLTNITLGRGGSLYQDIAFCDTRGDAQIIRPIRSLDIVEVQAYIKFNKLECLESSELAVDSKFGKSLQNVTKSFIDELQSNFPSTVSTIFRTGDKVSGVDVSRNDVENCRFCGSGLANKKSKTVQALEYSRFVSENSLDDRCDTVDIGKPNLTQSDATLCYGCNNIATDISGQNYADLI